MLRLPPIRSSKYLAGAKGQPCAFRGPTCNGDPATTVFAHLNGAAYGKGMGQKAHDIAGADMCGACHAYVDTGHGTRPLMGEAEFHAALLVAVIRTIVNRARRGIIIVPIDPERLSHDKPTKPRKAPADRAPIQSRGFDKGHRPMSSRNNLRKATT
jgi:hypothetical protein